MARPVRGSACVAHIRLRDGAAHGFMLIVAMGCWAVLSGRAYAQAPPAGLQQPAAECGIRAACGGALPAVAQPFIRNPPGRSGNGNGSDGSPDAERRPAGASRVPGFAPLRISVGQALAIAAHAGQTGPAALGPMRLAGSFSMVSIVSYLAAACVRRYGWGRAGGRCRPRHARPFGPRS